MATYHQGISGDTSWTDPFTVGFFFSAVQDVCTLSVCSCFNLSNVQFVYSHVNKMYGFVLSEMRGVMI